MMQANEIRLHHIFLLIICIVSEEESSMITCKNGVKWLYKLETADFAWSSGHPVPYNMEFFDEGGKKRLVIEKDGKITVTQGYSWDGCTPKLCFFDILLGTPDGVVHKDSGKPKTYYASLIHDALYQFLVEMPKVAQITRRDADNFFFRIMEEYEFAPRWVYWIAVRLFGGLAMSTRRNITRKTRGGTMKAQ